MSDLRFNLNMSNGVYVYITFAPMQGGFVDF